jgi:hypothetical protein
MCSVAASGSTMSQLQQSNKIQNLVNAAASGSGDWHASRAWFSLKALAAHVQLSTSISIAFVILMHSMLICFSLRNQVFMYLQFKGSHNDNEVKHLYHYTEPLLHSNYTAQ